MARYIDADAFSEKIKRLIGAEWDSGTSWRRAYLEFIDMIDEQPTADVVEVIRCRDCKHQRFYSKDDESFYCNASGLVNMHMDDGDGEFYCSYAERREE